jgi:transcriptional regulator with GAF, ATPase, and Fis domain
MIEAGSFREDLTTADRFPTSVAPLRERIEGDIPLLMSRLISRMWVRARLYHFNSA